MTVLADTSVWIEYWRKGRGPVADELDRLLSRRDVVVCGPVVSELFVGTGHDARETVWLTLGTLGWAELDRQAWRRAGEVGHALKQAGVTMPLTDITIAVAAVQAGAHLWSLDRDFERIRRVLPELTLYRPR